MISSKFGKPLLKSRAVLSIVSRFKSTIGIDLGTTNSCVSIMEGSSSKVIQNQEGQRTTPSVVAFDEQGNQLVGVPAKRQAVTNPQNTIYAAKRLIGRKFQDKGTQKDMKTLSYSVVRAKNGDAWIKARGKEYSPQQISAFILMKMKQTAENYLGGPVKQAVVTVPAYFNDSQRQATKDAGKIAGLDVERIINEPTAAALAFGLEKKQGKVMAVYDLGGGTFDVSVLEMNDNVFEVKATNGDTSLGGEDFDHAILNFMLEEFKKANPGCDISKDKTALQRMKEEAEKVKMELSSAEQSEINIPYLFHHPKEGGKHLQLKITRAKLESLCDSFIEKTQAPCLNCVKDAQINIGDIQEVLLVGGQTRMPKVIEKVKSIFKRTPNKSINPDEAVAMGAAIQGGVLSGKVSDVLLLDVTPLSMGIETQGGVFTRMIPRNTTIPTKKQNTFSTAADNQTQVTIKVHQGEREMAADNKFLGNFDLEGIPMAPKGVPQIQVTFDIDANGILNVSAADKQTGRSQNITIRTSGGLSDAEIDRMVKQAEQQKDADQAKKKLITLKNNSDNTIYQANKQLKDYESQIPQNVQDQIRGAIKQLEEAFPSDDVDKIQAAYDNLQNKSMEIGKHIQGGAQQQSSEQQQSQEQQASSDQSSQKEEEKTADSENQDKKKEQ